MICELLCFVKRNFDKLTASQLKPTLVSFYGEDELVNGTEILYKAVSTAVKDTGADVDLRRLPKRQGDNKCKQTAEDLLKLMTIADEKNLMDSLPRFVAEDLSRIPFVNADQMNAIAMARKLESLEQRMLNLEVSIEKQNSASVMNTYASIAARKEMEHRVSDEAGGSSGMNNLQPGSSGAMDTVDDNSWTVVSYKKPEKPTSHNVTQSSVASNVNSDSRQAKPSTRQKVIGTGAGTNSTAPATGVPLVQKAIVHIDNLGPDCTEALLQDYLLAADINVITCYKAKSWLRDSEKDLVTAFRVCLPANQRHLIFEPDLWAQGTVIRDWHFKKNGNGRNA